MANPSQLKQLDDMQVEMESEAQSTKDVTVLDVGHHLHRSLKNRQVQMVGFGGSIGKLTNMLMILH